MKKMLRATFFLNRWFAFLHDLLWIPVVIGLSYWVRFNFETIPTVHLSGLRLFILVGVPVQGVVYWFFGLYRGMWRFASIPDLFRILKAVFMGGVAITAVLSISTRLELIPRSVLLLYPIFLASGLCLPRLVYRWYKDNDFSLQSDQGKRVIIIGAGQAGELLLRDLRNQNSYRVVGFLDDDPARHGRDIHGVSVLGCVDELEDRTSEYRVEEICIAIPSANRQAMKRITEICSTIDIPVRVLPKLLEMGEFQTVASKLRPLSIEDLLGREQIKLDNHIIEACLQGKVILVTGGGGSIGSELCRQIAELNPSRLVVFEHGEYNLYTIEQELRMSYPDLDLIVVLGDIKNRERVNWLFSKFRPNVVYHAAAYKHVPMLESNPAEGVQNNVGGTMVLADVATQYKTEKFVLVSTDKAVNPANIMGTTKRIAELYCQNLNKRSGTNFITTRFGNVLGSTGSVVPLFQKQIERGGPVTVTHPDMKRFFMTIPEAVSLILQAGAMGEGSEIFVLDMGEQVFIKDMAEQMIRLSGLEPGNEIEIIFTGLRPGEKLYEELLHSSEGFIKTSHPQLLLASSRDVDWDWFQGELGTLHQAAASRDVESIRKHLRNIVPEFNAQ